MNLNLEGKVVLVTGGTGGIGTAIVKGFLAEGAKVAFSSTSQEKINKLLPTLGAKEGQVAGFVADMNKEEDIKNFVENAKAHFGTIDIVVPNAGYEGKAHPVQDMELGLFEQVYMLNVFSVMLMMKYAAPTLIEKKSGAVVVVASAAAYEPTAGNSAYVSSKYAVAGLTKCVAMELGPVGVHVNYVCPGPVDTPMMLRIENDFFPGMPHEEAMAMLAGAYAMDKRYAKPEEVANAVLYLASDVSAHTAGMGMHVDSKVSAPN
ncbi:MAG: SDR family oxidoreductase [Erysipelotrichales bacterium]|nr:SDR family oxidoreductase [Erysipelotrichales bacterium]MBQ2478775.1 SDR family oxidoreductase [Erysipelotrichales bacterium]MBQ4375569.1 SDR family oxidoreductase [Erysipelotrichales bacterium]MBQ5542479.1 SDR family oxidoreductase [Erysipelotrichales bacterium]